MFEKQLKTQGYLNPTDYQMYVAASICKEIAKGEYNQHVMTLGAGQGKTLVYLLVSLMLSMQEKTKQAYKKFGIITTTQPLLD